jgi:hypothetical protein
VHSLALREPENDRALAVKHLWQDVDYLPKRRLGGPEGIETLTDNPNSFAPAFWVQQMHFFNGDFRHSTEFETYFRNQQEADRQYSHQTLMEVFRYGLTAGVVPNGYHADRILNHPFNVFSPEAVVAWGDLDTMLDFVAEQPPASDPRYRYGLVRRSALQPSWVPSDTALVDHLFLLFGLVESLDPTFFADRVFPALQPGDFNADGAVDAADYDLWRSTFGAQSRLAADGNLDGRVDTADYVIWRTALEQGGSGTAVAIPEPSVLAMLQILSVIPLLFRRPRAGAISKDWNCEC